MEQTPPQPAAEHHQPWWRRASQRFGLQGKLILTFMALLTAALSASCYVFVNETEASMNDLLADQAVELASALALSSEEGFRSDEHDELRFSAANLLRSEHIVFVGFYDPQGRPLVERSRDPDFKATEPGNRRAMSQGMLRFTWRQDRLFGECIEVVAPVVIAPESEVTGGDRRSGPLVARPTGPRGLGYVAVALSNRCQDALVGRIKMLVLAVGCVMAALSLPLSYVIVRRIFLPIRELVVATNKISGGDLDQRVAIHRPDVIGTLARAFNEMVQRVRQQQRDVEQVNDQLAVANKRLAEANERLAEANVDLEEKVEQRTAQLETANRRLSQEIAEKEDFLRAISHDLNAPLRNIAGMATMLLMKHRDKFDEEVIHRLERIKSNVEVETDLIGELLELSRIKTRRQKMEAVETEHLVSDLRGMFEADLKSRDIRLIVDTPLPILHAERLRMRQVFQNLIDNAIKYMGEGSPQREIHVGCKVRSTEAEFYVRDTGMGIDAEDLGKVFFVFRRGKNSTAQNIAGKGVGLASVKSIVETYSGRIWAESEVGKGSTFRFTINGMHVIDAGRRLPPGGARAA
jgi:signal transduction histidine kinase